MEQLKEVKLVFCDYSADSFALANALISKVNLYKKTNIMEIFLQAKELIPIKEIQKFKKYVTKRKYQLVKKKRMLADLYIMNGMIY